MVFFLISNHVQLNQLIDGLTRDRLNLQQHRLCLIPELVTLHCNPSGMCQTQPNFRTRCDMLVLIFLDGHPQLHTTTHGLSVVIACLLLLWLIGWVSCPAFPLYYFPWTVVEARSFFAFVTVQNELRLCLSLTSHVSLQCSSSCTWNLSLFC